MMTPFNQNEEDHFRFERAVGREPEREALLSKEQKKASDQFIMNRRSRRVRDSPPPRLRPEPN